MSQKAKKERPEALAAFAESARSEKKVDVSLTATEHTKPIPTDPKKKDDAATKVLQEGATGEDRGAEKAVDELPDRIIQSRK
ncbi:MAG TPA: hypothetical protein VIB38_00205 [Aestuariivirgaceae bacterium]|jgi:hypothetical protein